MSALSQLCEQIIVCPLCELARSRTKAVPGEGAEEADLLFVGEGPGWHEDQQGRPFVGPAGQFLDRLLALIGLRREQVYITNIVKCRPPQNRDPLPAEIQACRPWLDRQVELIRPRMIVTLGRHSLAQYLPNESIGRAHGKSRKLDDMIHYPMYHPAAALHQASLRQTIESDMARIPEVLRQAQGVAQEEIGTQQLSMF